MIRIVLNVLNLKYLLINNLKLNSLGNFCYLGTVILDHSVYTLCLMDFHKYTYIHHLNIFIFFFFRFFTIL